MPARHRDRLLEGQHGGVRELDCEPLPGNPRLDGGAGFFPWLAHDLAQSPPFYAGTAAAGNARPPEKTFDRLTASTCTIGGFRRRRRGQREGQAGMKGHGLIQPARHAAAILLAATLLVPGPLPARDFFLQDGTEINLRLHTTVDSKISQAGDRIIATVEDAVSIDNVEVIPVGARVLGRIGEIQKPGRLGKGGRLVLAFESVEVPGAGNVQISGSLVDLYDPEAEDQQVKGLDVGEEGQVEAGGPSKIKRIGSTGAGGGLGAAIGVAVGAGVAFIWFKGKHVELPAGTGLVMRVDRSVAFAVPDMPRPAGSR